MQEHQIANVQGLVSTEGKLISNVLPAPKLGHFPLVFALSAAVRFCNSDYYIYYSV